MMAVVKVPKLDIEDVNITFEKEIEVSEAVESKKDIDFSQGCALKINK